MSNSPLGAEVESENHEPPISHAIAKNVIRERVVPALPRENGSGAAGVIEVDGRTKNRRSLSERARRGRGLTVWLTGLSSAGKTTISQALFERLWARGYKVEYLDGDAMRHHLSKGLGFSKEDRDENVRRIGFVAELLTRNGVIVLVSAISPYAAVRDEMRRSIGNFLEVFVNAPLGVCEQRDVKGVYRRARSGEIRNVTGVDDPYEAPAAPEVECRTDCEQLAESTEKVLRAVEDWLTSSN